LISILLTGEVIMAYPNTLIFVDLPSDDPAAAGAFYAEVFGWENDPRPAGKFHRMVPGQNFIGPDGNQSEIGNLHLGINDAGNVRPHPEIEGVEPRELSRAGRKPRVFILVSDDDSAERIMETAVKLGAETLWRNHYWTEFNGYNDAFRDPWGNDIVLWSKAGQAPQVPDHFTRE
jgi:predicted enzyme related to lactoylglutathione lyase